MSMSDKWSVVPDVEPFTKEQVLEFIKQSKWDKYVAYYLPRIIENYNASAKKEERIEL